MHTRLNRYCLGFILIMATSLPALAQLDRYVSLAGSNLWPFTNWDMAATNLRLAVNTANSNNAGDTVWVANGIHSVQSVVSVSNTVVRGVSGNSADVVINGRGAVQCFALRHTNAILNGLTLSNGYYNSFYSGGSLTIYTGMAVNVVIGWSTSIFGGGVYLTGATKDSAVVDRCLIIGNSASSAGGGVVFRQGSGTVRDSTIISNFCGIADARGGGIGASEAIEYAVRGCLVSANSASYFGGGIFLGSGSGAIDNCVVEHNSVTGYAFPFGGGVYISASCELKNSTIINNSSSDYAGGAVIRTATMQSCLIASNAARTNYGGGVYLRDAYILQNCTIVANTGGGIYAFNDHANACIQNCIVYDNLVIGSGGDHDMTLVVASLTNKFYYCCAAKLLAPNQGNITNAPLWLNFTAGNYRLQETSPCINTGTNLPSMSTMTDLDGAPRLDRFSRKVDVGAYEYIPHGFLFLSR